ncbi:MAG: tRNA (adenosine(37)-N6)-dimethylallyltransferase MiaA [Bacteroidetes bacterium]|nr:tRNA (adenosine(37)-N6)-dimethylallyltransferase MiaA [Bacteroidota bacterium]
MAFKLIVIAGPTASGKSALAEELSRTFHIPIISADSRQFYKEISIGTAKPNLEQLTDVTYHLVGQLSLTQEYNAGVFEREVLELIHHIRQQHQAAILCGGSGLYINAVCDGFDIMPQADQALRDELNQLFAEHGIQSLISLLPQEIYESLNESDKKNPQRLMRHIEISRNGGKKDIAKKVRDFEIIKFQVDLDREELYNQINHRVDAMLAAGLVEEVKSVYELKHLNSLQTVGYTELFDYIEGRMNLEEAVDKIKQHTRNYAKRQITWFNKDQTYIKGNPEELYHQIKLILEAS